MRSSELNTWQISVFDPCICLYMLMKLVFNFINSTRAYVYIKGNACIWLPIENRMKVNQCYVTGRSQECLPSEKNVNCDVFEAFVRTTDIIFPLVTSRENSKHDIHVTHEAKCGLKQIVLVHSMHTKNGFTVHKNYSNRWVVRQAE